MADKQTEEYWDLRLVNSAVKIEEEEKLTVELYGHTIDGKSIVVRDTLTDINKLPYFYIFNTSKEMIKYFEERRDVVKVVYDTLFYKGEVRDCLKVFVKAPKSIKYIREDSNVVGELSAADIPFHLRYIYDNDLDACIRVYGKKINREGYTADIVVEKERYDKISPFNPKLKVLSFDIENRVKDVFGSEVEMNDEEETEEGFFDGIVSCRPFEELFYQHLTAHICSFLSDLERDVFMEKEANKTTWAKVFKLERFKEIAYRERASIIKKIKKVVAEAIN